MLMHAVARAAGIAELVQLLHSKNTAVYLVSGGFRPIISPIAQTLNIPQDNLYANTILHAVSPATACSASCVPATAAALTATLLQYAKAKTSSPNRVIAGKW